MASYGAFLPSNGCLPSSTHTLTHSQVAESQGRVRIITSDGEFERELREAGEMLVVVDFTADWWVKHICMTATVVHVCIAFLTLQFTTTVHVPLSACLSVSLSSKFESYAPPVLL